MSLYNSYSKDYSWLSNFHRSYVVTEVAGHEWTFNSVEAAYQCSKILNPDDDTIRMFIRMSANNARQWGKRVTLRPDWEQVKLRTMTQLCRSKFTVSHELHHLLLHTTEDLVHLSPWDRFWGVDDHLNGRNEHGIILMHIREELLCG